jgi:hypothetical protein
MSLATIKYPYMVMGTPISTPIPIIIINVHVIASNTLKIDAFTTELFVAINANLKESNAADEIQIEDGR